MEDTLTEIRKRSLTKENLKIALISFQDDAEMTPPIGLVYLATYLRDRCGIKNVKIIDKRFDDINEALTKFSPDIIGIGPMTINYQDAIEFAEKYKKVHSTPIILGGVHISTLPISLKPCFDLAVLGEGELTLAQLIEFFLRDKKFDENELIKINGLCFRYQGKLLKTKPHKPIELDTLPFPDFDFVNKDYFLEQEVPGANTLAVKGYVLTARSCPYKCKFCSTSHFWGNLRLHSPEYSAKLIKSVMDKQKATYINVLDDLFTVSVDRLKSIKIELEKIGALEKIEAIDCQPRANLINDDMCKIMKELKVVIIGFGFESGSERILNWLKNGSVTVEMNKNAILLCKKYGFIVYGSLMFGSPGEKIEDMEKTLDFIDFASKNGADYLWSFISTPFPNTPFWEIALQRGKVSNDMDFRILSHHSIENPLMLDDDVDKKEFKRIFLEGRRKLRKMKMRMVRNFIFYHPLKTIELFFKFPGYYLKKVIKQIYKH